MIEAVAEIDNIVSTWIYTFHEKKLRKGIESS
jgi:hypothetical protein